MPRLIDANALIERLKFKRTISEVGLHRGLQSAMSQVEKAHTVDAVVVVRGHWKEYSHSALVRWKDGEPIWADRSVFRCSRCDFGTIAKHNYCPRCGAKMEGG